MCASDSGRHNLNADSPTAFRPAIAGPLPLPNRVGEFPNPLAAFVDMEEFLGYHAWTMNTIITAAVHSSEDGTEHLQETPLLMRFLLAPVRDPMKMNPANSWMLRDWYFEPLNYALARDPALAQQWIEHEHEFKESEARDRARAGSRYIAPVTVRFCIEGSSLFGLVNTRS